MAHAPQVAILGHSTLSSSTFPHACKCICSGCALRRFGVKWEADFALGEAGTAHTGEY